MRRFIFFTKTNWDEPARLRHHLARLLSHAAQEVLFFVKPRFPWQREARTGVVEPGITLHQHQELINHRLRFTTSLRAANAAIVLRTLRAALDGAPPTPDDVVVNFNYDYYFLRELFPGNRMITLINDDFIDNSPLGCAGPQTWALAKTCAASDRVLTVSAPLDEQVRSYCSPVRFEPWAEQSYRVPPENSRRDTLLFWGYINQRVDYDVVRTLAARLAAERPWIRLLFVGPIDRHSKADVESLLGLPNVEVAPPSALDELCVERIFASIIPYRTGIAAYDAISNPNKALQILARGIPLLISGMPHFFTASFVSRVNLPEIVQQIDSLRLHFNDVQPSIKEFVSRNGSEARLQQFLALVE